METPVRYNVPTNGAPRADERLRLFAKFVNLQYSSWCVMYQLLTGGRAPKLRDLLMLMK